MRQVGRWRQSSEARIAGDLNRSPDRPYVAVVPDTQSSDDQ